MAKLLKCHDCGVAPGRRHKDGCDVARCMTCGHQRLSCDCEEVGHDVWTGHWPGELDCERLGFWCVGDGPPGNHWRSVPAGAPGATHDLNRLYRETRWDAATKTRVLRQKVS